MFKVWWFFLFLMWSILKIFIEFVTILFLFYVLFFGWKAYGILAPRPGIEPTAHTLEGEVLPTGLSRKSHHLFLMVPFHLSDHWTSTESQVQQTSLQSSKFQSHISQLIDDWDFKGPWQTGMPGPDSIGLTKEGSSKRLLARLAFSFFLHLNDLPFWSASTKTPKLKHMFGFASYYE